MIKVLFVCWGNICRSPMAEFIFKNIVKEAGKGDEYEIRSAALSREEIGNDMYPPAKRILDKYRIPYERRAARQMNLTDCGYYDCILLMDNLNVRSFRGAFGDKWGGKVHMLMEFAAGCDPANPPEVDDPWYTGDFETAYSVITAGCKGLFEALEGSSK